MQINLHLSVDSAKISQWAAPNLNLVGLGWDAGGPESIETLMVTNDAFCRRLVSLYLAAHGASPLAQQDKEVGQ